MNASVLVSLRRGVYYIDVYNRTLDGMWVSAGTPTTIPEDHSTGALGSAIREALNRSAVEVPSVPGSVDVLGPLLAAAGVKTYATFRRGLKEVGVDADLTSDGELINVTPMKKAADGGPPEDDTERRVSFVYDSPAQVETAVLNAFQVTVGT